MVINNNIYYNSAYYGFIEGAITGRLISNTTAASYLKLTQAAQAFALQVDSLIAFDALVSTGASNTQLAITTNTIAANEQHRAGLLSAICRGAISGRYSEDSTQADYTAQAAAVFALWTEALLLLVTP